MLITGKEMLEVAKKHHFAVPAFNAGSGQLLPAIMDACKEEKAPFIMAIHPDELSFLRDSFIGQVMDEINATELPVALHLDHGSSVESCKKAVDAGFTSVMIDASRYSVDENIRMTKEVVEYAHPRGITVEAEIGHVGGEEDGVADELAYAKVEDAIRLAKETGIDFLAPALGSVHGIYKGEPKLDFERMVKIHELVKLPLVLHGGSGIPDELIKKAISCGICKININTELQIAWSAGVRKFLNEDNKVYDPRKIIKSGENSMKEMIKEKVTLFGSDNKHI